jgi:hypothetical protein
LVHACTKHHISPSSLFPNKKKRTRNLPAPMHPPTCRPTSPYYSLFLSATLARRWHAPFFLDELLWSNHRAISHFYLSLVAKERSQVLVLFPLAAFAHALSVDSASNTWRAASSPSRPTTSARALSPATETRGYWNTGVASNPLIVLFPLAALAALYGQTTDATSRPLSRPAQTMPPLLSLAHGFHVPPRVVSA